MSGTVIIGAQWGDEGKGRITDLVAKNMDMVVRFQGGDNAGHTVVYKEQEFKLHLIPSGILYPDVTCIIGNGVVINPEVLIRELEDLKKRGIDASRLRISYNAHLIMPYHIILDKAYEQVLGKSKIGTTHKGIGPAYSDKTSRSGIRVQDLLDLKIFSTKLEETLKLKNDMIENVYGLEPLRFKKIYEDYKGYAEYINKYIDDTSIMINKALDSGKDVLFEGAQGTFLDIDHGTYPFVTSSSTIAGGACIGAGVGPKRINKVLGVAKAYTTRVGSGPFPTEDTGKAGDYIREKGHEYGTTTGRPRRCGWIDPLVLNYSIMINSIDSLALTKIDVLTGIEKLKVCTGYRYEGKVYDYIPPHQTAMHKSEPVFEEMDGWDEDISGIREYKALPANTRSYIERIESLTGVPIEMISVGPERSQMILR